MSYELKCVNRFSGNRLTPEKGTYTRVWAEYINQCEKKKSESYGS